MKEEEKAKNEEQFLKIVYDTLKKVMKKRPVQPVYEYANMLLKKDTDKPDQKKNKDEKSSRKGSKFLFK